MSEFYDVMTPLGQNRCDTEQAVTDCVTEYMRGRVGDVLRIPAAATRCLVSQEGGGA